MKNRKVAYVIMTLALAVAVFLAWLLLLPAINLQDPLFWTFVVGTLFIWGILASAIEGSFGDDAGGLQGGRELQWHVESGLPQWDF